MGAIEKDDDAGWASSAGSNHAKVLTSALPYWQAEAASHIDEWRSHHGQAPRRGAAKTQCRTPDMET
jgi:hypothetical protein